MAAEKARTLAAAIAESPVIWNGESHSVTVSFGFYTFTGDENVGEALARADQAMYAHKQTVRS